ncbi:MAG: zf-HC2 domain-containing protein [Acidobacteria bacterium]|nr:zf-HC2 domain-containing protein [Acidobacteriota bacterium]
MSCEEVEAMLSLYVAGEVGPQGVRERVAAHLSVCESCRALAAEWKASRDMFRLHQPPEFDAAFFDGIRRDVLRQISEAPPPSLLARLLGQPFGQRALAYAAVFSMLVCAALLSAHFRRRGPTPPVGSVVENLAGDSGGAHTGDPRKPDSETSGGKAKRGEVKRRATRTYESSGCRPRRPTVLRRTNSTVSSEGCIMSTIKNRILFAIAITLILAPAAGAQQPAQPAPAQGDNYVSEKGFRSRVFEIRHRDPINLVRVLSPLGSGFKGAVMSPNEPFQTITVRDFPENIAAIEEAIKRLDVPEPARPGIDFHVHILVATNKPTYTPPDEYPEELSAVIKQLKSTINYKYYHLMTSQVLRAKDQGMRQVSVKGVSELKLRADTEASKNPIFYDFRFENIVLDAPASGAAKIQIGQFSFSMKVPLIVSTGGGLQYQDIGFSTPVNLREGEKVVVGTTSMEDKGIVVVLTGSITK